jgi:enoyl-CoA hydratase
MPDCRTTDVVVRVHANVVHAVLMRPSVKNAINDEVIDGLSAAVDLAEEIRARALVVRGAGGTFCSGADLAQLEKMRSDPAEVEKFMTRLGEVLDRIESASFPTIAVVEGYAVAGGCELLLACDVVVAATSACIGDRHLEYGLVPAAGGSVRLSRDLPKARANYLLLSGEMLSGEDAAQWGLVTVAVAPKDLEATTAKIVARIAGRGANALGTVKHMIGNARRLPQEEALRAERALFLRQLASAEVAQGLAAFRERRRPVFD